MRGAKIETEAMFSYLSLEERVPGNHSLRAIRVIADCSPDELDEHLNLICSDHGHPSMRPEHLLRSLLLQVFYSVCSKRQPMAQLNYNMLFGWSVGLGLDGPSWMPTVFTKNPDRLLDNGTAQRFFRMGVEQAKHQELLSEEHFSVDGTSLEAWTSQKSFQPIQPENWQGDGTVFRWQKHRDDTHHASGTDPDCRPYKKATGDAARLIHLGHVRIDNRHGLIAGEQVTTAMVDPAVQLIDDLYGTEPITLGIDKGFDQQEFVRDLRDRNVTPHVACKCEGSDIDGRTTRHVGYRISIRVRKRIDSILDWVKTVGGIRKTRFRGLSRVRLHFTLGPPPSIWCAWHDWGSVMGALHPEFGELGLYDVKDKKKPSSGISALVFLQIRISSRIYRRLLLQSIIPQTFSSSPSHYVEPKPERQDKSKSIGEKYYVELTSVDLSQWLRYHCHNRVPHLSYARV